MTYDNIKRHKKPGLHPLFRRYIFWKIMRGQIDTPPESYCLVLNHPPEIKNLSALVKVSPFQSCSRMKGEGRGRGQEAPLLKSVTYILRWWHLSVKKIQKNINHSTHLFSSAEIIIFSLEISNFYYIKNRICGKLS